MQKASSHALAGAPTALWARDFRSVSLPWQGFFSPFPRGTGSLSVVVEYLGLEGGPPGFGLGFTCPVLLGIPVGLEAVSCKGLSPAVAGLSRPFHYDLFFPWPGPATPGGKPPGLACSVFARRYWRNLFDFSSCGY